MLTEEPITAQRAGYAIPRLSHTILHFFKSLHKVFWLDIQVHHVSSNAIAQTEDPADSGDLFSTYCDGQRQMSWLQLF